MRKNLFALIVALILVCGAVTGVGAVDAPTETSLAETSLAETTVAQTTAETKAETTTAEGESEAGADETEPFAEQTTAPEAGGTDSKAYAIELWETAKDWIVNNLSTVVGALLALFTFIMGVVTKFSFVPRIVDSFKSLLNAVGTWYKANIDALDKSQQTLDKFVGDITPVINKVVDQSTENLSLRRELVELRQEHIRVVKEYRGLTSALLKAMEMQNEQLEEVFQISPLTVNDKDKHREAYIKKKQIIDALAGKVQTDGEIPASGEDKGEA